MHIVYACIQPNPTAHLDLIDYTCQDLMVSFAVGNKEAGLSNFSPIINVTVNIRGTCTLSNTQIIEIVNLYLDLQRIVWGYFL